MNELLLKTEANDTIDLGNIDFTPNETGEEIERRYAVASVDPELLAQTNGWQLIEQGYLLTSTTNTTELLRIRINRSAKRAMITVKSNKGEGNLVRNEEEHRFNSYEDALFLYNRCHLKISKQRYRFPNSNWVLDRYDGPLNGLLLAEEELKDPHQKPSTPPRGISGLTDVTEKITNFGLALVTHDLQNIPRPPSIRRFLTSRAKRVVFTGAPGAGKDTALEALQRIYDDKIVIVPEVATFLIVHAGVRPPGAEQMERHVMAFQRTVYRVQTALEDAALVQAEIDGKEWIFCNRGVMDSEAYCGGREAFAKLCGISPIAELNRYYAVIQISLPNKETYDRIKRNNPARHEEHPRAIELQLGISDAWKDHPRYIVIQDYPTWDDKEHAIISAVTKLFETRPL